MRLPSEVREEEDQEEQERTKEEGRGKKGRMEEEEEEEEGEEEEEEGENKPSNTMSDPYLKIGTSYNTLSSWFWILGPRELCSPISRPVHADPQSPHGLKALHFSGLPLVVFLCFCAAFAQSRCLTQHTDPTQETPREGIRHQTGQPPFLVGRGRSKAEWV